MIRSGKKFRSIHFKKTYTIKNSRRPANAKEIGLCFTT
jgi:hypothetical protein